MIATIYVIPMGKPRGLRSDKWKKRPVMVKYWAFKDEVKAQVSDEVIATVKRSGSLGVRVWMPFPKSYSAKKQLELRNAPHQQKPDLDNVLKGVMDTLWPDDDSFIWTVVSTKRWEDGGGARIELEF